MRGPCRFGRIKRLEYALGRPIHATDYRYGLAAAIARLRESIAIQRRRRCRRTRARISTARRRSRRLVEVEFGSLTPDNSGMAGGAPHDSSGRSR